MSTHAKALAPRFYSFPGCPAPAGIDLAVVEELQRIVHQTVGDQQGILYGQAFASGARVRGSRAVRSFRPADLAPSPDSIVGYYKIRDDDSIRLTQEELDIASRLFAKPGCLVLLIGRRAGHPDAKVFLFDEGSVPSAAFVQFPLDAARLGQWQAERFAAGGHSVLAPVHAEIADDRLDQGLPANLDRPTTPANGFSWRNATAILAVLVLAIAFLLYRFQPRPEANPEPSAPTNALMAERLGEDVRVTWNLNPAAIAGATSGALQIDDGGATRRIPLDASQIRSGSVLYTPLSEQLTVQLTTANKNNETTGQGSIFVLLRQPAAPPVAGADRQSPPITVFVRPTPAPPLPEAQEPRSPAIRTEPAVRAFVPPPAPAAAARPPAPGQDLPVIQVGLKHVDSPVLPPLMPVAPPPPSVVTPAGPAPTRAPAVAPASEPAKAASVFVPPVLISQPGVTTPPELRPFLTGPITVKVDVTVNEEGRVTHADPKPDKVVHVLLLKPVVDAAMRCRFQPARQGQRPVPSHVILIFRMGLDSINR
jgi:hypothetical protein